MYKQSGKIDFSSWPHKSKTIADGRGGFKVREFAKKFNLGMNINTPFIGINPLLKPIHEQSLLGDPIAVNFFLAEFDDSVPKLYASFTG